MSVFVYEIVNIYFVGREANDINFKSCCREIIPQSVPDVLCSGNLLVERFCASCENSDRGYVEY
jgi:hypothetical protein